MLYTVHATCTERLSCTGCDQDLLQHRQHAAELGRKAAAPGRAEHVMTSASVAGIVASANVRM